MFTCGESGMHQSAQRHELLESLESDRLLLQTLTNNVPGIIFQKDREGRYLFANRFLAELVGLNDPKNMIGKTDLELFPRNIAEKFMSDDRVVIETARTLANIEETVLSADGLLKWFLTAKVPLHDRTGQVTGLVGIGCDITERKEIERKNKQLATLVECSDEAIVSFDLNRNITTWNKGAERLYGYTAAEIIGAPTSLTIPPELEEEAARMREQLMRSEELTCCETTRLRKDGSRFEVSLNLSLIKNEKGGIVGIASTAQDITARKLAEKALRDNEKKQRDIINLLPDATLGIDDEARVIIWNRAIERMTGISAAQMIGKGGHAYAIPFYGEARPLLVDLTFSDPEEITRRYSHVTREGDTFTIETFCNALHNNKGAWVFCKASLLRDQSGRIIGAIESIRDITERKQMEEALRKSAEHFGNVVRNAPLGIFRSTPEGHVIAANPMLATILGYDSPAELVETANRKDIGEVLYVDGRKRHAIVEEAVRSCQWTRFEERYRRKNGELITANLILRAYQHPLSGAIELEGFVEDISERKKAEEALRDSEQRYRLLVENSNEGILVAQDGRFKFVNRAGLDIGGYSEEGVFSKPFLEVVDLADRAMVWKRYLRGLRGEKTEPPRLVLRLVCKNGDVKWVELRGASTCFEGRPAVLAIVTDITDLKRAEEEKVKLERQLQQVQKMEFVGRLAGGVAHDFNNMLGVILGHTEMALEQVSPKLPLHADLNEIRNAAERSASLTRQLLTFARKQTVTLKVLILNRAVERMLTILKRLVGENVNLIWRPKEDIWPIKTDPSQIDQVLTNLCINSRDAIKDVGRIIIETDNVTLDEAYCSDHPGCVAGEYVRLTISDDGSGMDKETLSHLFEPFFTTKEIGKGTGLGLATVYGIVKQNNGYINVSSELGHGTTVTIFLPREMGESEQPERQDLEGSGLCGHETILLVEDEPVGRKLISKMLERHGYTVITAATAKEAIRLAREHAEKIHLLMTDVVMPEMNGRDLARNLLSIYPHIKCLFTSGYPADVIDHHGVLNEGVQFIQKPFSRQDLVAKVREALDSGYLPA